MNQLKSVQNFRRLVSQKFGDTRKNISSRLSAHPLLSFFGMLALLLVLIVISSRLQKAPIASAPAELPPTTVSVFGNGKTAEAEFVGKVDKGGVITIMAQTAGVVQKVNLEPGQKVGRGQAIVSLSTTYGGGSPATISRQLSQKNVDFTNNTYPLQLELIQKQRDLANKGNSQAVELREIGRKSLDDTRGLISLNEEIFNSIDSQIKSLEANNVNGSNDAAIMSAKQGKAAVFSGLLQLRSQLRQAEYQTSDDKIPAQLADTSRDLTLKQLDLQEQSLALTKDVAELNLKLARLGEAVLYPTTPCAGVVERVFVQVGDMVNPGDRIAVIQANTRSATAIVNVPADVARQVSPLDASTLSIGGKTYKQTPDYISREATDGSLFSISFSLPDEVVDSLTEGDFINVRLPLASAKAATTTEGQMMPLDAIYQAQDSAFVYVVSQDNGKTIAKAKTVTLGAVSGSFVQVTSGLETQDQVIVTRGISDGQAIQVQ